MLKILRQKALLLVAIVLICVTIFPFIFLYGISRLVQGFVSAKTAARIEAFWDMVGVPYSYLIRQT